MAEAATLASLKWVISPLISRLWNEVFNRLGTSTEDQHKMLQDLETNLLPGISLAIERAEKSPRRHLLENWLERLKDAYYKTEEAIDLFHYCQLQQKVKDERKSRKITDQIKTGVGSLGSEHRILTSTKKQISDFLQTVKEFINYRDLLQDGDAGLDSRETIAEFKVNEIVVGRDKDIETVVSKLKEENLTEHGPNTLSSLPIIAITGRPGVGKTTLAKYVYNYARKEGLFDIFMWVYLPRKFKASDVINKMMKVMETKEVTPVGHLTKQKNLPFELEDQLCSLANKVQLSYNDNSPLQSLLVDIKSILRSKKCLLILDNFGCNKGDDKEWENFTPCLSSWGSGSKILLTTHSPKVANQINVPQESIHELDQLGEGPMFEIFMYHASDNNSNVGGDSLEVAGRKIAKKLKGDPKAAEVLGALLRTKDIMEWQKISEKDWSGDEMESRIWSYQNLHANLQRCFAFCGLFPKGFRFGGDMLIHLWMAEGFIKPGNNDKRMEDIGESYLHELVSNYFLDKRVDEQEGNYYVLHELLSDLAERVCGDDCIRDRIQ